MQSFYPYGNRKDYPNLKDEQWGKIGWDVFQDCLVCDKRHRCGQTLSREHYRKAADLLYAPMISIWSMYGRMSEETRRSASFTAGA